VGATFTTRAPMKDPGNTAKQLLDLPFAPEAEAFIDELERSGQFRIGIEAEQDDESAEPAPSNDYSFGRGSGHVTIQDWWTTGRVRLRISDGLRPDELTVSRVNDSLVLRTPDGLDRVTLEGYLGLIPDASTLLVVFGDGVEWSGAEIMARISSWLTEVPTAALSNH
jgi:hypothetical protein